MKKIEAIIRKPKFNEVKKALHEVDVNFFSYWEVNSVNKEKTDYVKKVSTTEEDTTKKFYISILVNDDFEDVTIKAILESAYTGEIGDGRIFISTVDDIYKIRTKEKGTITLR